MCKIWCPLQGHLDHTSSSKSLLYLKSQLFLRCLVPQKLWTPTISFSSELWTAFLILGMDYSLLRKWLRTTLFKWELYIHTLNTVREINTRLLSHTVHIKYLFYCANIVLIQPTICKATTTIIQKFKLTENNDFRNFPLKLTEEMDALNISPYSCPFNKEGLVQMLGESFWKGDSFQEQKAQPLPLPECKEACLACFALFLFLNHSFNRWTAVIHLIGNVHQWSGQASSSSWHDKDKRMFLWQSLLLRELVLAFRFKWCHGHAQASTVSGPSCPHT